MLICYCYQYSKEDIEQDFLTNGKSTILEKIMLAKKDGNCDCQNKNPAAT